MPRTILFVKGQIYFFFDTFTTQKVEIYFSFWAFTNKLVRKPPLGPPKNNLIVRKGWRFYIYELHSTNSSVQYHTCCLVLYVLDSIIRAV